jgi:hypothetical protein
LLGAGISDPTVVVSSPLLLSSLGVGEYPDGGALTIDASRRCGQPAAGMATDSMRLQPPPPTPTVDPTAWGRINIFHRTGGPIAGFVHNQSCGQRQPEYKDNHNGNDGDTFLLLVDIDGGRGKRRVRQGTGHSVGLIIATTMAATADQCKRQPQPQATAH